MKSLDLLVIRKLSHYLADHPIHGENLAQRIREAYERMPVKGKPVCWSKSEVPSVRMNSDYVKLSGYLKKTHHLPAALVGACMEVLSTKAQHDIAHEFLEPFGLMPTAARPKPAAKITSMAAAAQFMKETGEAFAAVAALLENDNEITTDDGVAAIRHALMEVGQADAALEQVRALLVAALPTGDVIELKKKA